MMNPALSLLLTVAPGSAAACAVCFGGSGAKGLMDGISWGIIILLTATMTMVGGIGYLLYKVEKNRPAEDLGA